MEEGCQQHDAAAEDVRTSATTDDARGVPYAGQDTIIEYEDEFPIYLNLLKDLPPTSSYERPEDELRQMPEGNKDSGWQTCLDSVEKYDKELCQTYREQIDTLLVFAGLFSAVVTAFAVESYQWLQDDPRDTSVELLRDVVTLLSQDLNVTAPPAPVPSPRLSGSAVARINLFWFLSLSLSLSAALVGILCKQWLREFERNVGQSPEKALAVRHIRFQGFEYWKVGSIVMSVPIIMQMALGFFMIGIVELLWRLHVVVACCVTVVAGLTLLFFLATTFLPAIQYAYICTRCCIKPLESWLYCTRKAFMEPQCAFKSAQAWLVFLIIQPVIERMLKTYGHHFSFRRPPHDSALLLKSADSWDAFDINWVNRREHIHVGPRCAFQSLAWIAKKLGGMRLRACIWHCVWARWLRNRNTRATIAMANMDIDPVARSYPGTFSLDPDNPPRIAAQAHLFRCSLSTDLPVETAIELLLRVAPAVGVNSQWTCEAARAVLLIYAEISIRVSDDLAVGLFRLAEAQTHALITNREGPNSASQLNAALAFKYILLIIHQGSPLRSTLIPAMSGMVLQWLRSSPPSQVSLVARRVFEDVMSYLESRAWNGEDWRLYPGIILVAKLAGHISELWPEYVRERYMGDPSARTGVLQDLLAMLPLGSHGLDARGFADAISTRSGSIRSADGVCSTRPAPDADANPGTVDDAHVVTPWPLSHAVRASQEYGQSHLCIEVHGDAQADATAIQIDVNCPASPSGSPVPPASLQGNTTSPEPLV